jgi:hydrogenase/urease accessory protein HupE
MQPGHRCILLLFLFLTTIGWSAATTAHRLRPAVVNLTIEKNNRYNIAINLNMEAVLAGISPQHADTDDSPNAFEYDTFRLLEPDALEARIRNYAPDYLAGIRINFDQQATPAELTGVQVPAVGDPARERLTTLTLTGTIPENATTFTWTYAEAFGASALRVRQAGAETVRTAFLTKGQTSEPFDLDRALEEKPFWQVVSEYVVLGFTHILPKGLDHILFVLGIYLLSQHWRPLLYQVTAFTVAHSITLGLSLYGVISLSPNIVEPLIALSIVYVAVENIVTPDLKPWRVFVVFGFGLLHGLGFADVLMSLGLPRDEYLTGLIAFNIGVELGQLSVIAGAFLAVGLWLRNRAWYRQRIVIPASLVIAVIGAYWTIERTAGIITN